MEKTKKPSWAVIILLFIVFWPAGVYLLIKRLSNDKVAEIKTSKVTLVIGVFFLIGAFVMFVETVRREVDLNTGLFVILFYLVGGGLLINRYRKMRISSIRYKKLIDIVNNQQQHTIENIASLVNMDYKTTVKELQKMIDKGYFKGAYIDHAYHEIRFPVKNVVATVVQAATAPAKKTVKCPNCGGNNVISVGQVGECDFCGSPIE